MINTNLAILSTHDPLLLATLSTSDPQLLTPVSPLS